MVCDSLMYWYHDTEKGKQVKENDSFYTQDNTQLHCIVKLTLPSVAVHETQKRITVYRRGRNVKYPCRLYEFS